MSADADDILSHSAFTNDLVCRASPSGKNRVFFGNRDNFQYNSEAIAQQWAITMSD
jgi:hypothetical protein